MLTPNKMTNEGRTNNYFAAEILYEGWNFHSGNYLFTTDTK